MVREAGDGAGQVGADGLAEEGEIRRAVRVGRRQGHERNATSPGPFGRRGRALPFPAHGSVSELHMSVLTVPRGIGDLSRGLAGGRPGGARRRRPGHRPGRHSHRQRPGLRFGAAGPDLGPADRRARLGSGEGALIRRGQPAHRVRHRDLRARGRLLHATWPPRSGSAARPAISPTTAGRRRGMSCCSRTCCRPGPATRWPAAQPRRPRR